MPDKLLVTGAAGHLGSRVLAHLLDTQKIEPDRIVAATRDPSKLADVAARGVTVVAADFEEPATLVSAFKGVDRLLLISINALNRSGQRRAQHKAAVAAAKGAGVNHVVYTSIPDPDSSRIPFAQDHLDTEQALAASGLGWTVLRNGWYFENLLRLLPPIVSSGRWLVSAGNGRLVNVSREDCARAAAAALACADGTNRTYDITGPQALTPIEIAATAAEVLGRPIAVIQADDEQLKQSFVAAGVPQFLLPFFMASDANERIDSVDVVSDAVEQLTGKPPVTLGEFLATNRDTFLDF